MIFDYEGLIFFCRFVLLDSVLLLLKFVLQGGWPLFGVVVCPALVRTYVGAMAFDYVGPILI